jgi:Domain of unknown function (DUF3846)
MTTDGAIRVTKIDGTLEAMQALVGGMVEPIRLNGRTTLWVNEEGRILSLPLNCNATMLVGFEILGDAYIENPPKDWLRQAQEEVAAT